MPKRFLSILAGLCFPLVTPVWSQTLNMDPIQVRVYPYDHYTRTGGVFGSLGADGRLWACPGPATNLVALPSSSTDIRYGDKIRLQTYGTIAYGFWTNGSGTNNFVWVGGPEIPQPFLGVFCGSVGALGGGGQGPYRPIAPVATGLPEYVTPMYTNFPNVIPTDIPEDFLIPPEGVTLCVPPYGNFLVLLSPEQNQFWFKDEDCDFGVEIQPLEKPRLAVTRTLSSSNVMVGDTFTLTLGFTNYGNAPVEGVHMYIDDQLTAGGFVPLSYYTNLLEMISGPVPSEIASIPPGGSAQITYTFKAIDAGTNYFYARIGRTICGGTRFQQFAYAVGPQVITSEIIVNSTADLPNADPNGCCCDTGRTLADGKPECTLRAAIEFANRHPGRDTIKFRIQPDGNDFDAGVPVIRPGALLQPITNSVILDGWSQAPNSPTPPVEIDFQRFPTESAGLLVQAPGTEIRGFVLNGFRRTGIELATNQNVLQGNFIGTDPSGMVVRPSGAFGDPAVLGSASGIGIWVRGSDNLIGGTDPMQKNVIAVIPPGARPAYNRPQRYIGIGDGCGSPFELHGPVGIEIWGNHNRVEGNYVGVNVTGLDPLPVDRRSMARQEVGIRIRLKATGNQIGGTVNGAGNVVAGNNLGILVEGSDTSANAIRGNWIGTDRDGAQVLLDIERDGDQSDFSQVLGTGIVVRKADHNTIGGFEPGAGNVIANGALGGEGIKITGQNAIGNRVLGNWIGVRADGVTPLQVPDQLCGITVDCLATETQIEANVIASAGFRGISHRNGPFASAHAVIRSNRIFGCSIGIEVISAEGVQITRNRISDSGWGGIDLTSVKADGSLVSLDPMDLLLGSANRNQAAPRIYGITATGGSTRVQLDLTSRPLTHLSVEFFSNAHPNPDGYGEGETYLATIEADTGVLGGFFGEVSIPVAIAEGEWLTATAADLDGNTSEFSKAVLVQSGPDADADGMSNSLESQVPNRIRAPAPEARFLSPTRDAVSSGDGNGDGILDSEQPNVTSFPSVANKWITLVTSAGVTLHNVVPSGAPEFSDPPAEYGFPLGFVSLTLSNLPAGGSVALTNIFHDPVELTTVFAYGPTPDNPQPHWYELTSDFTGDELRLTFIDGGIGDHDLTTNGVITTLYAPAYRLPLAPSLSLLNCETYLGEQIVLNEESGIQTLTTNQVLLVTTVLTWPVTATNWFLQLTDSLSPIPRWQTVFNPPAVLNNQNIVTNTAASDTLFYRLRQF